jgi:hypothetical protein
VAELTKQNKAIRSFQSVVSGNFLSRDETLRFLPFLLFLSLLAILYIANGYYSEAKMRRQNKLTEELKDLRSEYIITKSDLMFISKQSEVAKSVAVLGLKESVVPPKKIVVQTKNQQITRTSIGD